MTAANHGSSCSLTRDPADSWPSRPPGRVGVCLVRGPFAQDRALMNLESRDINDPGEAPKARDVLIKADVLDGVLFMLRGA